jgi:hypothetical protein
MQRTIQTNLIGKEQERKCLTTCSLQFKNYELIYILE